MKIDLSTVYNCLAGHAASVYVGLRIAARLSAGIEILGGPAGPLPNFEIQKSLFVEYSDIG